MNKANIALFLGISPQNYGRYEAGRIPDAVTLSVIADRCGVTVDWLLGRDPSPLPSASSAPPREISPSRSREAPAPYAADPSIPAIEDRLATIEQLLLRLLAATSPSPTQENPP